MLCRTLGEVLAAADADSAAMPPPTQAQVNYAAMLLAPYLHAREPQAA
jgi:hypothetical protein